MSDLPTNDTTTDPFDQAPDTALAGMRLAEARLPVVALWGITSGRCDCGRESCEHAGKHPIGPLLPHGVKDASTDAQTVVGWFASYPNANLGVATGHELPGGGYSIALDVDPARGGADSLARWEVDNGPLPRNAAVESGGGGEHIWMRSSVPLRQSRDHIGPGLEVKSAGGYVVMPPSTHQSGKRYRYVQRVVELYLGGPPDAPEAFVTAAQEAASTQKVRQKSVHHLAGEALARAEGAHDTAKYVARQLRLSGAAEDEAVPFMIAVNAAMRAIDPGVRELPVDEIASLIRWTYQNVTAGGAHGAGDFEITKPDLVRVRPLKWAWRDRVLLGALNLLVGAEGVGKGTLIAYLIAKLSRGELDGDLHGDPATVVLIGDEDSFDLVWTPRLHVADADLERVREVRGRDGGAISFPRDARQLREIIATTRARVVIFDQLLDNLDAGVDDWRSKAVRRALAPVRALAQELDVAVLGVLHINKEEGTSFRRSVSGSHGFNALSRSSLLVAQHPEGPNARRVVARGKGNYGPRPDSLEFMIDGRTARINGHDIEASLAFDFKPCAFSAESLLAGPKPEAASKAEVARRYIMRELEDGDWHDAKPIIEALQGLGIAERVARKAREDIGAESERKPEYQGGARWRLRGRSGREDQVSRFTRSDRNGNPTRKPDSPASPANGQALIGGAGIEGEEAIV
jgi:Bifunctional DNA primase/polymerase, N-terminal/AAA domain